MYNAHKENKMTERMDKLEELLHEDEFALIIGNEEILLLVPKGISDDEPMPLHGAFLSGCAITAQFMFSGKDE